MQGTFRFSFGPWNIHEGADPFGPEVRHTIPFNEKLDQYKKLGFDGVQFHDDDAVPNMAKLTPAQIVKEDFSSLLDRNRFYYRYIERLMDEGQRSGELADNMAVSEMVRFFSMQERALVTEWCMNNGSFSLAEYSRQLFPVMLQGLKK